MSDRPSDGGSQTDAVLGLLLPARAPAQPGAIQVTSSGMKTASVCGIRIVEVIHGLGVTGWRSGGRQGAGAALGSGGAVLTEMSDEEVKSTYMQATDTTEAMLEERGVELSTMRTEIWAALDALRDAWDGAGATSCATPACGPRC